MWLEWDRERLPAPTVKRQMIRTESSSFRHLKNAREKTGSKLLAVILAPRARQGLDNLSHIEQKAS